MELQLRTFFRLFEFFDCERQNKLRMLLRLIIIQYIYSFELKEFFSRHLHVLFEHTINATNEDVKIF